MSPVSVAYFPQCHMSNLEKTTSHVTTILTPNLRNDCRLIDFRGQGPCGWVGGCEGVRVGIMRMNRLVLMNINLGKNRKEQRAITTCLKSILHYAFLACIG